LTATSKTQSQAFADPFEPGKATWEKLVGSFTCPEWFRDAKFGVWSHWGPQAVPGCNDWYARFMYMEEHSTYRHHCRTYGHPSKFGYKDIVKMWKAEKFDAEALVGLFADNGAKYFMGQAAHSDNFDLFNSKHHRWNATNFGPMRDILGEYERAARNAGIRFGFSEHLAWTYSFMNVSKLADKYGPYKGVSYDGVDPEYQDFYQPQHDDYEAAYPVNPSQAFIDNWSARLHDAIDQLNPDIFYTDGGIFGQEGLDLMAYFYSHVQNRTGSNEGVYTYKDVEGRRGITINIGEFRSGAGVEDLEHGVLGEVMAEPWQTDTSSGPWYWDPKEQYKTPEQIVHMLADIVSKNGNLLLNYTQRPDGSLDDETTWIVKQVGQWLRVNGEAIYGTRPWNTFGEGPGGFRPGEFGLKEKVEFGYQDFRFTTKAGKLYAIALGRPAVNERWCIKLLAGRSVKSVEMLGTDEPLKWSMDAEGLWIAAPSQWSCDLAWSFCIELS